MAALTCLCLKTSLERVHHEALIHTMTVTDRNWPVAFPHNVSIVLGVVNTTDDCNMLRQLLVAALAFTNILKMLHGLT